MSNILECAGLQQMCPISWNVQECGKCVQYLGMWQMCQKPWNLQDCGKCVQYLGMCRTAANVSNILEEGFKVSGMKSHLILGGGTMI